MLTCWRSPLETNECLLCGCACDDVRELAGHLLAFHSESRIGQGKLCLTFSAGMTYPAVLCWCGHWDCSDTMMQMAKKFARHLQDRGGLAAHLLELALVDYYEIPF